MGTATTSFFRGTYDETLSLIYRARDYLADEAEQKQAGLSFALESMRLTARLTRLMAWLLAQRAVHAGEMRREDALDEEFRLQDQPVCSGQPANPEALPAELRHLLDESDRLYRRVARLDGLLRQSA